MQTCGTEVALKSRSDKECFHHPKTRQQAVLINFRVVIIIVHYAPGVHKISEFEQQIHGRLAGDAGWKGEALRSRVWNLGLKNSCLKTDIQRFVPTVYAVGSCQEKAAHKLTAMR